MPGSTEPTVGRKIAEAIGVAVAYYVLARLGLQLAYVGSNVTLVWPPTGIAVAALFRLGLGRWPGIFAAATLVNLSMGSPLWTSALIGAGNTAGPALVAWVLRKHGFRPFDRLRDAMTFLATIPIGMMVAPTVGLVALHGAGQVPPGFFGPAWLMWWVGDLNGALVVGPVLLTLHVAALGELRARMRELLLVGVTTLATAYVAFFLVEQQIAFVVLLPVVWAALRFPGLGSSLVVLAISSAAVWATAVGRGPFAGADVQAGLIVLSGFLGSAALGNLIVIALLAEQGHVRRALEASEADRARVLQAAAAGMWEYDLETGTSFVDEGMAAIIGLPREIIEAPPGSRALADVIHPADRARVLAARQASIRTGVEYDETYRIVRPDGEVRWISSHGRPSVANGKVVRVAGLIQDVTARIEAEQAKRHADERLALAARLAGLGTWELDARTGEVTLSEELAELLGLGRVVRTGLAEMLELVHEDDRASMADAMRAALDGGSPFIARSASTAPTARPGSSWCTRAERRPGRSAG